MQALVLMLEPERGSPADLAARGSWARFLDELPECGSSSVERNLDTQCGSIG